MTLSECQDQCAKLRAEGKTPKSIILTLEDAKGLPKGTRQLFGLNVTIAVNYEKSVVIGGYVLEHVIDSNTRKIIER